jgi:hypothetical protein
MLLELLKINQRDVTSTAKHIPTKLFQLKEKRAYHLKKN